MTEESPKSYQSMLEEVETIVTEMSSPDLDLDNMVTKVEKGYQLIEAMKERLSHTKMRIEELHNKYE
ncbi:MAG: exodeoxyribonuclease VII small subunit [Pseudobacteriovorax sp.]|nr:exodeoxyribonuclease VII small subunit [Pseudobacteriovorax sp.]